MVVDEVPEHAARRLFLRAREQSRLERCALGVALLRLLGPRAQLGRVAPRTVDGPYLEQPLVERERRAAVLLVVALDVVEDRVLPALDPLLEADDRLVSPATSAVRSKP